MIAAKTVQRNHKLDCGTVTKKESFCLNLNYGEILKKKRQS